MENVSQCSQSVSLGNCESGNVSLLLVCFLGNCESGSASLLSVCFLGKYGSGSVSLPPVCFLGKCEFGVTEHLLLYCVPK